MSFCFSIISFYLFLEKKVAKIQENLTLPPTSLPHGAQNFPATALLPFRPVLGTCIIIDK
jgi:hypothetical protein